MQSRYAIKASKMITPIHKIFSFAHSTLRLSLYAHISPRTTVSRLVPHFPCHKLASVIESTSDRSSVRIPIHHLDIALILIPVTPSPRTLSHPPSHLCLRHRTKSTHSGRSLSYRRDWVREVAGKRKPHAGIYIMRSIGILVTRLPKPRKKNGDVRDLTDSE